MQGPDRVLVRSCAVGPVRSGDESGELLLVRVTPTEAERMTRRIRVHTVTLVGFRVHCILEESSAEIDRTAMRCGRIGHVEIDMDLLWVSIGPIRLYVVRRMLDAYDPIPAAVDDAVEPRVVVHHVPVEHGGPERTLGRHVRSIEHNHMTNQIHGGIVPASTLRTCQRM